MDSINPDPKNIPDKDLRLQNYQDDLDTSSHIHDPVMSEVNDDPTEELGVDKKEFKKELDKYAIDEPEDEENTEDDEDRREDIEGRS